MPKETDADRRAALEQRTLYPEDLANEVDAKRAENRIVVQIEGRAVLNVRRMLQRLRRRLVP